MEAVIGEAGEHYETNRQGQRPHKSQIKKRDAEELGEKIASSLASNLDLSNIKNTDDLAKALGIGNNRRND